MDDWFYGNDVDGEGRVRRGLEDNQDSPSSARYILHYIFNKPDVSSWVPFYFFSGKFEMWNGTVRKLLAQFEESLRIYSKKTAVVGAVKPYLR